MGEFDPSVDRFGLWAVEPPPWGATHVEFWELELIDSTSTAFQSDALLALLPDLGAFDPYTATLMAAQFRTPGFDDASVSIEIQSLAWEATPITPKAPSLGRGGLAAAVLTLAAAGLLAL